MIKKILLYTVVGILLGGLIFLFYIKPKIDEFNSVYYALKLDVNQELYEEAAKELVDRNYKGLDENSEIIVSNAVVVNQREAN